MSKNNQDFKDFVEVDYNDDIFGRRYTIRLQIIRSTIKRIKHLYQHRIKLILKIIMSFLIFLSMFFIGIVLFNAFQMSNPPTRVVDVQRKDITNEEFLELVKVANYNQVEEALKSGVDINSVDYRGRSALTNAVMFNPHVDVINLLLTKGSIPDFSDNNGFTSLIAALNIKRDIRVIQALVNSGANLNSSTSKGTSVLMSAVTSADKGYLDVIKYLIEKGANVNYVNEDGVSPLMMSVKTTTDEVIPTYLLDMNANPVAVDTSDASILAVAKTNKNLENTEFINRLEKLYSK